MLRFVDCLSWLSRFTALALLLSLTGHVAAQADSRALDDQNERLARLAPPLLELGTATGSLIWTTLGYQYDAIDTNGNKYVRAAERIQRRLEIGRKTSRLVQANTNFVTSVLATAAAYDPEPITKTTLALAAYGSYKTAEYFGNEVLEQSRTDVLNLVSSALRESNVTAEELAAMTPEEYFQTIRELKVGSDTLAERLADEPEAREMIEAHVNDFEEAENRAAILDIKETQQTVEQLADKVSRTNRMIGDFQDDVGRRLDDLDSALDDLTSATKESQQALKELQESLSNSQRTTNTLSKISYLGWSTAQKLEAVRSGLFSDLSPAETSLLEKTLAADLKRENSVRQFRQISNDLGSLTTIASNLGLPDDLVLGLSAAQIGADAVSRFVAGDYLGAAASVSNLIGLGRPSAASRRHKQMMEYLAKQFEAVHVKLDQIIELQVATLAALESLSEQISALQVQVSRIESLVLSNNELLKQLVEEKWISCRSVAASTNGLYHIDTLDRLVEVATTPTTRTAIRNCYEVFMTQLPVWRDPSTWDGTIIDATHFDGTELTGLSDAEREAYNAYKDALSKSMVASRNLLLEDQDNVFGKTTFLRFVRPKSALLAARVSQPGLSTKEITEIDNLFASNRASYDSYECGDDLLSDGLQRLMCYGLANDQSPRNNAWNQILNGRELGPNTTWLIDVGILVATLVDLAETDEQTPPNWYFANESEIRLEGEEIGDRLRAGIREQKGLRLLKELQTLSDALVLQQSSIHGDYLAYRVFDALYDSDAQRFTLSDENPTPVQMAALTVMRNDATTAQNVVTLGIRAYLESTGRPMPYSETRLALATKRSLEYRCRQSNSQIVGLNRLFRTRGTIAAWRFEYRNRVSGEPCPTNAATPSPHDGWGMGVSFGDFWVPIPDAKTVAEGTMLFPASMRLSYMYRDRLQQAIAERELASLTSNDREVAAALLGQQQLGQRSAEEESTE